MEKLINALDNLEESLDNNIHVINIKKLNKEVLEDFTLMNLLDKYHNTLSSDIKKDIINYPLYRKYMSEELEINFIILEINKRLKKISNNSRGCI